MSAAAARTAAAESSSSSLPPPVSPASSRFKLRLYLVRHGESEANRLGIYAGQIDSPLTRDGVDEARALGRANKYLQKRRQQRPRGGNNGDSREEDDDDVSPFFFYRAYASDLARARDTCLHALRQAAAADTGGGGDDDENSNSYYEGLIRSVKLDPRLRERSYGVRQGMPHGMSEGQAMEVWQQQRNKQKQTQRRLLEGESGSSGASGDSKEEDDDGEDSPPPWEGNDAIWARARDFFTDVLEETKRVHRLNVQNDSSGGAGGTAGPTSAAVYHVLVVSHAGVIRQTLLELIGLPRLKEMGAKFDAKRSNRLVIPNTSVSVVEIECSVDDDDQGDEVDPLLSAALLDLANAEHLEIVRSYDD